ncbi:MAG: nodulation protein NfeD, partial [Firmicutes bacterium]|nr:nodulation protein NfeD [Bacillota bacterium]
EARRAGVDAAVIEIDTFGGFVDAAVRIRDEIMGSGIRTIAYVNPRAWSAGALIAISCEQLAMQAGSSMGAAETRPREEKSISAVRAEFESTAEMRGRDPRVAGAMVDADVEIPELIERGKILTLTASKARELEFSDFTVKNRLDLLEQTGLSGARTVDATLRSSEWLARGLTHEIISQLLLTLGMLGLVVEVLTPGFGVPGTIGVVSLALFFGGRVMGGTAGWEVVAMFIIGFALLLVEVFVIPGFGVAGILGIASIMGSLILSYPTPGQGLTALAVALFITVVLTGALVSFLSSKRGARMGGAGRIILDVAQSSDEGYLPAQRRDAYLGMEGVTLTPLRPVGTVEIGEDRVDALSEGGFIAGGVPVRVIRVEGSKVVVRPITTEGE